MPFWAPKNRSKKKSRYFPYLRHRLLSVAADELAKAFEDIELKKNLASVYSPPISELVAAARRGYKFAHSIDKTGHEPMEGVNSCPYGPAWPGEEHIAPKAHAWYKGWWFYWYIVKRWKEVANGNTD